MEDSIQPRLMPLGSVGLANHIRSQFKLDWEGIHGPSHWARVRAMGLELALVTGADPLVVELFAWFHDACRLNDGYDPGHGARGAELAGEARGKFFEVNDKQLALLQDACRGHSDGRLEADVTVQTCWDSDRLDLGRVGNTPDPRRLCTDAARSPEVRHRAEARSERWRRWIWSRR